MDLREAQKILGITDLSGVSESDLGKLKKRAYVRWHPDKVTATGDEAKILYYADMASKIQAAITVVRLFMKSSRSRVHASVWRGAARSSSRTSNQIILIGAQKRWYGRYVVGIVSILLMAIVGLFLIPSDKFGSGNILLLKQIVVFVLLAGSLAAGAVALYRRRIPAIIFRWFIDLLDRCGRGVRTAVIRMTLFVIDMVKIIQWVLIEQWLAVVTVLVMTLSLVAGSWIFFVLAEGALVWFHWNHIKGVLYRHPWLSLLAVALWWLSPGWVRFWPLVLFAIMGLVYTRDKMSVRLRRKVFRVLQVLAAVLSFVATGIYFLQSVWLLIFFVPVSVIFLMRIRAGMDYRARKRLEGVIMGILTASSAAFLLLLTFLGLGPAWELFVLLGLSVGSLTLGQTIVYILSMATDRLGGILI